MRKIFSLLILLIPFFAAYANQPVPNFTAKFVQNKGQLPKQVLYSAELPQGWLFLEPQGLTYNFLEPEYFNLENTKDKATPEKHQYRGHAFQVQFVNSNPQAVVVAQDKLPGYSNYFIGNDETKWASEVNSYKEIRYNQLFQNIDLRLYTAANYLKYDYIVAPYGNVADIKMKYQHVQNLKLRDGKLLIQTTVNTITEEAPYAYQVVNGKQQQVTCAFTLNQHVLSFKITGTYDPALPLIIDPKLIFTTYTGSTSGISANCTTADTRGNTYASGYSIGEHYPITPGAYQTTRLGGNVVISKFNANGSSLIYATYLGGSDLDYPFAMTINKQDELIILGNTNSKNFPISSSAYDKAFSFGLNAADYFVSKLSSNGANLLASTYLGGDQIEGGNLASIPSGLTLDDAGNIYVGGSTESSNFPIVNGFQKTKRGAYDGVVVKLNPNLSSIMWSSYLGGSRIDLISDIKVGASGKVYVTGSTLSFNLPTTDGALHRVAPGNRDGFIAVLDPSGSQISACTYVGTSDEDLVQFIDIDKSENVYIAGFTSGSYPITPGTFGTVNGTEGYFIHKLNATLTSTMFSTHIGSAPSNFVVPTAFNVDKCENIYLSGYSLPNLPVTADALEKNHVKSLYLCHLSTDAKELIYGSYFGGAIVSHIHQANHSTITDAGILHHIECTTSHEYDRGSNAYSEKKTTNFDGAISKFEFNPVSNIAFAAAFVSPPTNCAPYTAVFNNTSTNGINYTWNFGDGSESKEISPVHTFEKPGKYQIRLVASNPASCLINDTTYAELLVEAAPVSHLPDETVYLCDKVYRADVGNEGFTYLWSTGATTPTIDITEPGTYSVDISSTTCQLTDSITVKVPLTLQMPNIITPNNDGKNDFLVVKNTNINPKLTIYNRWGAQIYQNDHYQNDWNGTKVAEGIYYYLLESSESCNPAIKGWLEIVR